MLLHEQTLRIKLETDFEAKVLQLKNEISLLKEQNEKPAEVIKDDSFLY